MQGDEEDRRHREPVTELRGADLDALLREVQGRVEGVLDEQARLRLLLEAVLSMAADLSSDGVLQRIVTIAGRLVDARYAALGVLSDVPGKRLRTFVHHGMGDKLVATIGPLPEGHGVLGLLIDRPEPLRLHDINEHPQAYGFPAHHPPMRSFLGVPVRIRDRVFGNLYLTEKAGGADFTPEDEEIVVGLATAAGVVIENASLYAESARRQKWLAATAEITALLTQRANDPTALHIIADRAREVSGADVAWIVSGSEAKELVMEAVAGATPGAETVRELPLHRSLAAVVVETRAPVVVDDIATDPRALDVSEAFGLPGLGPAVVVPSLSQEMVEGALALAWERSRSEDFRLLDPALPASFAEHAALALRVSRAHDDRRRLSLLEDRDRIARELHDVVIQRLFATGLSLQSTARLAGRADVAERLDQTVDELDTTIKEIRRSIFALSTTDASHDIQVEVSRIVERAAATLKVRPTLRFEGPVRTLVGPELAPDVLAVLAEALSNASRHAEARAVDVLLSADRNVVLRVIDDGRGLGGDVHESGLRNMRERAERRGGTFVVESAPGAGTSLTWSVPLARTAPDAKVLPG